MAKRPSLEPKKTTKKDNPWLVELSPAISSTGKRQRVYFKTKKLADEFCAIQRIRLQNYGTASATLPAGKVEEAVSAFRRLDGSGATLTEAVEYFLKARRIEGQSVTFKTMFERFMEVKSRKSQKYLGSLRYTLPRFQDLHEKLVVRISSSEIEAEMKGMTISVRHSFMRNLRAAFNYAIRQKWCTENPVMFMETEVQKRRTRILTNSEVEALLASACRYDIEFLPYQLFCIFAGIRPEETERLSWTNVNFSEGYVEVPEKASKTGLRRIVTMEATLKLWLEFYQKQGGRVDGDVVPRTNRRKRIRLIRANAGITDWPQDAPRRTYASCWLSSYSDVNRLNYLMGHTEPDTLFRHYNKAVTEKQAEYFWKILPPIEQLTP